MNKEDDIQRTIRFIQDSFRDYYKDADILVPPRFTKREYGFFYLGGKGMQRPVAFKTRSEVKSFLSRRAPAHCYFSSAYYERPEVPMAGSTPGGTASMRLCARCGSHGAPWRNRSPWAPFLPTSRPIWCGTRRGGSWAGARTGMTTSRLRSRCAAVPGPADRGTAVSQAGVGVIPRFGARTLASA